ncbi:BH0509 family protein [Caldalkalibacillus mannanilyticus]|nr:BH0509 family protein [Caldalkalibacillus mannanilyticus]
MLDYLKMKRGLEIYQLAYLTDADIEYLYEVTYFHDENME